MKVEGEGPTDAQVENAVEAVVSQDSLLPGEAAAIGSPHPDDAMHWRTVYEELFGFKQALLTTLLEQRGKVNSDGRREIESDEIILTREAERLSRRLEFWRRESRRRLNP